MDYFCMYIEKQCTIDNMQFQISSLQKSAKTVTAASEDENKIIGSPTVVGILLYLLIRTYIYIYG